MTDPKGHPDWQPFTITPGLAEARDCDLREMTVDRMRSRAELVAKMDEYGKAWREIVREGLDIGLTVEEIAAEWNQDPSDVHAALYGHDVWPLHDAGVPCAAIARQLGISREIVAAILGPGADFGDDQREN